MFGLIYTTTVVLNRQLCNASVGMFDSSVEFGRMLLAMYAHQLEDILAAGDASQKRFKFKCKFNKQQRAESHLQVAKTLVKMKKHTTCNTY